MGTFKTHTCPERPICPLMCELSFTASSGVSFLWTENGSGAELSSLSVWSHSRLKGPVYWQQGIFNPALLPTPLCSQPTPSSVRGLSLEQIFESTKCLSMPGGHHRPSNPLSLPWEWRQPCRVITWSFHMSNSPSESVIAFSSMRPMVNLVWVILFIITNVAS